MKRRRVQLVGMSGVRIWDPELRALGMTLPGFIERGEVIASLPCLGLLTLAGLTPPDWEISYAEVDALSESVTEQLLAEPADLVAISSLAARIEDAYVLADRMRAAGRKVVIGGLHASALPDEAAEHADALVVGEGEAVWRTILEDAADHRLQPRYLGHRAARSSLGPFRRSTFSTPGSTTESRSKRRAAARWIVRSAPPQGSSALTSGSRSSTLRPSSRRSKRLGLVHSSSLPTTTRS